MQPLNDFYYKLKNDRRLQNELIPLIDSYIKEKPQSESESVEFIKTKFFPIAQKYGINFTVDEFIRSTKREAAGLNEVNDEHLAEISGGDTSVDMSKALLISMVLCFSGISQVSF